MGLPVAKSRINTTDLDVPPQDLVAERSVLGSILLDQRCYDEICEVLKNEHFYSDVHKSVYSTVSGMIDNGKPVDSITVADRLDATGLLDEVGGVSFIMDLLEAVPHAGHAKYHAEIIRDKWTQRQLQSICQESLRTIRGDAETTEDVLDEHERAVFRLSDQKLSANQEMPISDIMADTLSAISARDGVVVSGLSSGFRGIDEITNGFHSSTLTILAARPSMGKTAFVCNLAHWFMNTGMALIVSLEQSKLELAERFLAIESRVDGHAIRKGRLEPAERAAILDAAAKLSERGNMYIDDTAGRSVAEIRSICRRIKRKHGLSVVIIDYLQLIEPEDKKAPREIQVATISRRLKGLAKDLNIPIICLAQLNRGVELREDKRPKLADLRESGAIEQDADVVSFLHRPDAYDPEDRPGLAEIIIAKHRSGPTGIVNLQWRKQTMRFEDGYEEEQKKDVDFL